jgi:signal transduction histidine kinase
MPSYSSNATSNPVPLAGVLSAFQLTWQQLSLSRQFLIVAGFVLLVAMFILGEQFSRQLEQSALATAGLASATLIDSYLEPPLQKLDVTGEFDDGMAAAFDRIFEERQPEGHLISVRIWGMDGKVLYSSNKLLIGEKFGEAEVASASQGTTSVLFHDVGEIETEPERFLNIPLMEIYAPLHSATTGKIIAVAEFYEDGQKLSAELQRARLVNWAVVGGTTLLLLSTLYLIVRRGSMTIYTQKRILEQQIAEARVLADQNTELRKDAEKARLDASQANEKLLAHIGADLHDGPVQLLTLMMLKLSMPYGEGQQPAAQADEDGGILALASSTLAELRAISAGLQLPEIANISLEEALRLAVFRHEDLTATSVTCEFGPLPADVPPAIKTCFYRIVQEGLSNAYRHGRGIDQRVSAHGDDGRVIVTISDGGPGLGNVLSDGPRQKLGLVGMANRAGVWGGSLVVEAGESAGVRATVSIPIPVVEG